MLKTNNLSFRYSPHSPVLSFPVINCMEGEAVLITGESGSGKTTLLSLLGGLLQSPTGMVEINGTSIKDFSNSEMDKFRGKYIGFVLQQHYFIEGISVVENLLLSQKLAGNKPNRKEAVSLLDELGIANRQDQYPSKLSTGERQRLDIARALINRPALILADEPTSALDNRTCESVIQLLKAEARQRNTALVVVTHDERLKNQFTEQVSL